MKSFFRFPKLSVRRISAIAILLAISYLLSRFSITIIPKQLVIGFTFITGALIGTIVGPSLGFIVMGLFDIFNTLLSEKASMYLFGWTVMAAIIGFFYGMFFYGRLFSWSSKRDWTYVSVAVTTITILGSFIITPILIQHYYGVPILAQFIAGRWIKIIEIPLRIIVTMAILSQVKRIPEYRKLLNRNT